MAVFIAGCASQIMADYIGKSIREPILDYGPPINEVDLGGNRRAFQWRVDSSGYTAIYTPSTTTLYGMGSSYTAYTSSISYVPYSNSCIYTLTAIKQDNDYIVDGYRKPNFFCE